MKKILIIQTAFLGDVILATPLIKALNKKYSLPEIHFLVRKGNESLLANNPLIKSIFTINKKKARLPELKRLITTIRKEEFNEVINLHRYASSGIIAGLSRAKHIIGFKNNPFSFLYNEKIDHSLKENKHEIDRNLACLKIDLNQTFKPCLYPSLEDEKKAAIYKSEPYYCFAPASVWFTKQLPQKKWVELIQTYSKKGKILLLGGPSDINLCEQIIEKSEISNIENTAGKLPLLASASLMRDAIRNFVNDSGPLHISSAMNAPVTAFFCSTSPTFGFGPVSDDSMIIQSKEDLKCKPCGIHGLKKCPLNHFNCGNTIILPE